MKSQGCCSFDRGGFNVAITHIIGLPVVRGNADGHLPELPYPRMPIAQRAKIFIPFNLMKGFQEALCEKEREAEKAHRM